MDRTTFEIGAGGDYYSRLAERLGHEQNVVRKLIRLRGILESAQSHVQRLAQSRRRYLRARNHGDRTGAHYELEIMSALLYEIADTVFMVCNLLELNELDLSASADGQGLVGEHAAEVVYLFDRMESYCKQLLQFEREMELRLDFQRPVDEKEGVTYSEHVHWQDFVRGSVDESFFAYFSRAQREIRRRISQPIAFLGGRTVREQLQRKGRTALLELIRRLEDAPLSGLRIERSVTREEEDKRETQAASRAHFSWGYLGQ